MLFMTTWILSILTTLMILLLFMSLFLTNTTLIEWTILTINSNTMTLPILLDQQSLMFLSTVLLIASSVLQFSKSYMENEKFLDRFITTVILFVLSMMILIIFPNMMTLLLGWDGLGITSFILVIYYQNPKSLGAGMITALTNRIGDVLILISIALIMHMGHWNILNLWYNPFLDNWTIIMIMMAACTKSAQVPFSAWLPAAMAAPTPVSALVHSSTLVTAGVYILYRFYPFLHSLPLFHSTLALMASITMLMAGCSAMAECDMKKIIALSTLSQLGVMMFTLSIGLPNLAFFHLITHALFKALLFICAGFFIHYHHHNQNLRVMGNIVNQSPTISTAMLVANTALCGAPFMAGFYSKDLILESFFSMNMSFLSCIMFVLATILTTAYTTRFIIYTSLNPTSGAPSQYTTEFLKEIYATAALTLGACTSGSIINWLMITPMTEPALTPPTKLIPIMMILMGVYMGHYASSNKAPAPHPMKFFNSSMWFLAPLSSHSLLPILMNEPLNQLKYSDQGWNETPMLLFSIMNSTNNKIMKSASTIPTTQLMFGMGLMLILNACL